ncbi:hypothetical protein [Stakelama tenebrarum]|uniref:Uncharacterized protein n=1 Tax=Stakelama tenebrarum TaxID=2711215 RepID=A0A6G6YAF2_9SPHN|nr:hypothetical protein [Sphingosinithalassobacter tenebrarum]QIG81553.1 hypothetical protein G5C33_18345 [Sphingosinithalassobacter tenebrarum]
MSFLDDLLAGGPDYRVARDIGGAIFGPAEDSEEALERFQSVVDRIVANDGLGYRVVKRLIHRTSDYAQNSIDRLVINF